MADSAKRSSSYLRRLAATLVMACSLLAACDTRAEIVLDEFVDPFQIVLPQMEGQYQTQLNVGPLSARRSTNCYAERATTGRIDANLTVPSALYGQIDRVNIDPAIGNGTIGINVLYFFNTIDATQGGVNDRVVLDFAYLHSAIPMARVTVAMQDATDNYVSQQFNVATRDEPFSLEFPFSSFAPRGGGGGGMDTQHIHIFALTLTPAYFTTIDAINFSTALERIRLTSVIPEPKAQSLFAMGLVVGVWWSARNPTAPPATIAPRADLPLPEPSSTSPATRSAGENAPTPAISPR